MLCRDSKRNRRDDHARAVDEGRRRARTRNHHRAGRKREQRGGASKNDSQHHDVGLFRRTPRPPLGLTVLSEISSMPSASSALTSFISESTLPRMTPLLASM